MKVSKKIIADEEALFDVIYSLNRSSRYNVVSEDIVNNEYISYVVKSGELEVKIKYEIKKNKVICSETIINGDANMHVSSVVMYLFNRRKLKKRLNYIAREVYVIN